MRYVKDSITRVEHERWSEGGLSRVISTTDSSDPRPAHECFYSQYQQDVACVYEVLLVVDSAADRTRNNQCGSHV